MDKKLLRVLCCPKCYHNLNLEKNRMECKKCNSKYVIFENVPMLLINFRKKDFEKTKKSFSQEWQMFKKGDKTWTWNIQERKVLFLKEIEIKNLSELKNKLFLDAGCGNGQLTAALGDYCKVVGMDLSTSIFGAEKRKKDITKNPENVLFIQANIMKPPFKKNSFDIIYSSGVLHHTPSTFDSFKSMVPLLKKGGKYYIYLYRRDRKDETVVTSLVYKSRNVTKHLPLFLVNILCTILAPFSKIYVDLATKLNVRKSIKRNLREHKLSLYDHFAPRYAYRHTIPEVLGWFYNLGFKAKVTFEDRNGFGVLGIKL